MKAWVLKDLGRIVLEDRERPSVGEHEVLVKVSAAGRGVRIGYSKDLPDRGIPLSVDSGA